VEKEMLYEVLGADDTAEGIDIAEVWRKNHKGDLTVSHIPDTHNGMLKKDYISIYMDALTL